MAADDEEFAGDPEDHRRVPSNQISSIFWNPGNQHKLMNCNGLGWINGHRNSEADDSGGSSCSRDLDTRTIVSSLGPILEDVTSYREQRRRESLVRRTCTFCGKVCPKPSDLQRHLMKHTGERPFGCEACGRKFKAKRSLQYHLRAAHGEMVELSPGLQEKLEGVTNPRRRPPLPMITVNPTVADMQMEPMGTGQQQDDDEYDEEEAEAASAAYRQASVILGLLQSGFLMNPVLNSHRVPITQIPDTPLQKSPEHQAVDDRDSQVFSVASLKGDDGRTPEVVKYRVHPRSEEIIATRMEGANLSTGEKAFLYKCHWCSKIFLSLGKLQSHLTVHSRRSRKVFTCPKCGEVFQLRTQFRLHQVTHFNPQSILGGTSSPEVADNRHEQGDPWVLSEEGDSTDSHQPVVTSLPEDTEVPSFSTGSTFQELRFHDEILRHGYRCKICGKTFDRPFSLHRHERIHTGVKPCFCKDCGRGFSEPRNLRHHIIRFHSDGSQRHLLRRNRGGISFGSTRATSSPQGMVSFLREQRINFSEVILPGDVEEDQDQKVESTTVKAEAGCSSSMEVSVGVSIEGRCGLRIPKEELEGLDNVTVIFPTAVPETNVGVDTAVRDSVIKCQNADEVGDFVQFKEKVCKDTGKEILIDPKRSLMGNRRKLKPRKMVCKSLLANMVPQVSCDIAQVPATILANPTENPMNSGEMTTLAAVAEAVAANGLLLHSQSLQLQQCWSKLEHLAPSLPIYSPR